MAKYDILKIGDVSDNGQILIVDQDRLCYKVKSTSRGSVGIRTISKDLLDEYVLFFSNHTEANANDAREALSGKSDIDKYEYGYTSTLTGMAKMILGKKYFNTQNHYINVRSFTPCLQQIYYGAPGTGKSYEIKEQTKGKSVIRTTFHPDSDYSTFVGCYKPSIGKGRVYGAQGPLTENGKPIEEPKITYKYVAQAFLKAYLGAWKKYVDRDGDEAEPQFLVIEEINRGNCAQIFGDLFQLLDRGENGFSEYPIEADTDLQHEIDRTFKDDEDYKLISNINVEGFVEDYKSNYNSTLSEDIQHGRVLLLPRNLYVWATMNTSDQSLFPIDSAFKRRWEWKYIPIGYKNLNWIIEIGTKNYYWVDFQKIINQRIYDVDNSEDKQLGDYFVNADRTGLKISADTFLNKILFYIWNDVCKDDPDQIFRWIDKKEEKSIKFSDFFDKDKDKKLQGFMAFHKVPAIGESTNSDENEAEQNTDEPKKIDTPEEDDNEVNS